MLAVALAVACGDDDDASSPTPADTATRTEAANSETPTATTDESGTPSPSPTLPVTATVSRNASPATDVDHHGVNTTDILGYYRPIIGDYVPTRAPCVYEASDAVADCTASGYGRISLDVVPTGEVTECFALLGPDQDLIAVTCLTATPASFFYKVED